MKALVKAKAEEGIWMQEVPKPKIGNDEVLIKIKKTAICGTDVHIYNWDDWSQKTVPVPLTIGHEFMGEIVALGGEVSDFKVGERVSGEGHIVCGTCRNCRAGREHYCRNTLGVGVNRPGAFAEYLAIPAHNAYRLPPQVPDEIGAILDPFGNAAHTALSFDLIGEDVLITGAGPIGIMAGAIAKKVGARHIVITDLNAHRLTLAQEIGIPHAINPTKRDLRQVMEDLGMVEGFDVGLEMSGSPIAFNDMLRVMNHGGKVAILGIPPGGAEIDMAQVIFKGLTLKGIYGREMFETWYKMVALIQEGLDLGPILTHRFPIDRFQEGFDTMRSGLSGKVILEW
ncbi:MAG: L-threonine 3-dehydrogenase [Pseudomonadota bacterium]